MADRPPRAVRLVLAALIGFHGLAVVGSLARGTPPGDAIRQVTRPYEKLMGVYQNWTMFAPNAPRSTRWMRLEGQGEDGTWRALEPPAGPPPDVVLATRYRRLGKVERNLLDKRRRFARRSLIEWHCAREAGTGRPLRRVRVSEVTVRTPTPAERRQGLTHGPEVAAVEERSCPG